MRVDPKRPMEKLVGDNYGVVRLRCRNMHVNTPFRVAARECRPKNIRSAPPALRRGLLLAVMECLAENRAEYRAVMFPGGVR